MTLLLGGAAEELLPKVAGMGLPVLLAAVQILAYRRATAVAMLFALAAGGLEDALSSLPVMLSASYFLLVAAVTRWTELPRAAILLTYPGYQVWLEVWTNGFGGGVFYRILLAIPMGIVTVVAVGALLIWAEGKAAIDEAG